VSGKGLAARRSLKVADDCTVRPQPRSRATSGPARCDGGARRVGCPRNVSVRLSLDGSRVLCPDSASCYAFQRQASEVRTVRGNPARTALCAGGAGLTRIPTATVAEERGDHSPYADLLTLRFSIPRFLGNKFAP
jgi:hypothetical protein